MYMVYCIYAKKNLQSLQIVLGLNLFHVMNFCSAGVDSDV